MTGSAVLTGGGVGHSFEVVDVPPTLGLVLQLPKVGCSVHFAGMTRPAETLRVTPARDFLTGQKTLVGEYMGSADMKRDIPRYADLYMEGCFDLDDLIARQIGPTDINTADGEPRRGAAARGVITAF